MIFFLTYPHEFNFPKQSRHIYIKSLYVFEVKLKKVTNSEVEGK